MTDRQKRHRFAQRDRMLRDRNVSKWKQIEREIQRIFEQLKTTLVLVSERPVTYIGDSFLEHQLFVLTLDLIEQQIAVKFKNSVDLGDVTNISDYAMKLTRELLAGLRAGKLHSVQKYAHYVKHAAKLKAANLFDDLKTHRTQHDFLAMKLADNESEGEEVEFGDLLEENIRYASSPDLHSLVGDETRLDAVMDYSWLSPLERELIDRLVNEVAENIVVDGDIMTADRLVKIMAQKYRKSEDAIRKLMPRLAGRIERYRETGKLRIRKG